MLNDANNLFVEYRIKTCYIICNTNLEGGPLASFLKSQNIYHKITYNKAEVNMTFSALRKMCAMLCIKILNARSYSFAKVRELRNNKNKDLDNTIVPLNECVDENDPDKLSSIAIYTPNPASDKIRKIIINKGFNLNDVINDDNFTCVKDENVYSWSKNTPRLLFNNVSSKYERVLDTKEILPFLKKERISDLLSRGTCYIDKLYKIDNISEVFDKIYFTANGKPSIRRSFVRSPMGSKKTTLIKQIAELPNTRIMIITPRVLLCEQISKIINIPMYSSITSDYHIFNKSVVTTIHSLYKFDINNYDIVIFDEINTIFDELVQMEADYLNTRLNDIIQTMHLIFQKKAFLCLDAFLSPLICLKLQSHNCLFFDSSQRDNKEVITINSKAENTKMYRKTVSNILETENFATCSVIKKSDFDGIKTLGWKPGLTFASVSSDDEDDIIHTKIQKFEEKGTNILSFTSKIGIGMSYLKFSGSHIHYDASVLDGISATQKIQMLRRFRNSSRIYLINPRGREYQYIPSTAESLAILRSEEKFTRITDDGRKILSDAAKTYVGIQQYLSFMSNSDIFNYHLSKNFSRLKIINI